MSQPRSQYQLQNRLELKTDLSGPNSPSLLLPTDGFRSIPFSSTQQSSKPNSSDSTPVLGLTPVSTKNSPHIMNNLNAPQSQLREFVKYRPPTVSMIPVEDIPLPPKMHRTFDPESHRSPDLPQYDFESFGGGYISGKVTLEPDDGSVAVEKNDTLDSVKEEAENPGNLDATSESPENSGTSTAEMRPECDSKTEENKKKPNEINAKPKDVLIVYGPAATTLNTSLGIPVNGLAKNPSILRHYSYKHRPKTGPRPPVRNDSITLNKKKQQQKKNRIKFDNTVHAETAEENKYSEFQGRRSNTTVSSSRPAHKELTRKATLQAIRNDEKKQKLSELLKPAEDTATNTNTTTTPDKRRNRAYTVANGRPTASVDFSHFQKLMLESKQAKEASGNTDTSDLGVKRDELDKNQEKGTLNKNKLFPVTKNGYFNKCLDALYYPSFSSFLLLTNLISIFRHF